VIHTARLAIVRLTERHLDGYRAIVQHPDTGLYDEGYPKSDQELAEDFAESLTTPPLSPQGWNEYGVVDVQGHLVGLLSHRVHEREDGQLVTRMGYHFSPDYQGRGYATEAVAALLGELARRREPPVECVVERDNERSLSLLRRLGFEPLRPTGELQQHELLFAAPAIPTTQSPAAYAETQVA